MKFSTPIGILLSILSIIILISLYVVATKTTSMIREGFSQKQYRVKAFVQKGCGPCAKFGPAYETFSKKVESFMNSDDAKNCPIILKCETVDLGVDKNQFSQYSVKGTPTVLLTNEVGEVLTTFNSYPATCEGLANWASSVVTCLPRDVCSR